ncbi:PhoX family protein [Aquirhabdus sp.]|uniref:PhoX family protein n=1 Tax=Aquirhabdus sp. TaxID=2824160 RepID=UPI00396CD8F1
MSELKLPTTTRRQILKYFASAPLLPMAVGGASASMLVGCSGDDDSAPAVPTASFKAAVFLPMAAPTLAKPAEMATTLVNSSLEVTLSDDSKLGYVLSYKPFFITGDLVADGKGGTILAGGYVDINNKPIIDKSVVGKERQFFSDSPDGTSLLSVPDAKVDGVKGKPVFAVVQFEYTTRNQAGGDTYGQLPSPIAVLTLDQDQTTGQLSLVKYHNVDTSKAHGLWITCGASLSPWGTHLSSEEYEPDAFTARTDAQFQAYSTNVFGSPSAANPYHYGHLPEVTVNPDGTGSIKKHYCLGRISHELIQVMPDNRTALMGDDNTNSGLFIFVADKEKDLSAGTLYVAKLGTGFSVDTAAAGAAISWINLGHATSAEIENLANTLKPTDIMEVLTKDPSDTSFTKIFTNGVANWIKVKPGMEKAAAFLETHRYAYLKGGSMGFTKMEGTTVNIKDKTAYSALQNCQDSMVKDGKGWNAASGIALDKPLKAGVVMAHTLTGGQVDLGGAGINSEWVPVRTKALLSGEDISADTLGNTANPNKIGNPDNLKFSEKLRTLFIGEDSSQHVNNFVWAYNVDTKALVRLMSMPAGAEATGLGVVDDLNGWTYITTNFQHAGDWGSIHKIVQPTLDPLIRANYKDRFGSAVGYLTASPQAIKLTK